MGYEEAAGTRYPVLYLLHGRGDTDETWTSLGRANFTLDNAIDNQGATPTTTGNDVIIGFTGTNSWEFRDSSGSQIAEAFSDEPTSNNEQINDTTKIGLTN